MRSGRLDRRIRIEFLTTSQNGTGEEVQTWATLATVWASRESQNVVQKFNTNQLYAEVDTVFRTRWFPHSADLDPLRHRIIYRDRTYDLHGVFELGRRDGLQLLTSARLDNDGGSN